MYLLFYSPAILTQTTQTIQHHNHRIEGMEEKKRGLDVRAPCPIEYQLPPQFVYLGPPPEDGEIVEVFANNHMRPPPVEDVTLVNVFANNHHMTAIMSHLLSGHSLLVAC